MHFKKYIQTGENERKKKVRKFEAHGCELTKY